ncbi:MAG: metallophosphoesterase family protein [Planctomycetota bacterium]|jgi:hypothetical protein
MRTFTERTLRVSSVCVLFTVLVSAAVAEPPWRFIAVGDSRSTGAGDNNGVNIPILTEIAAEIVNHGVDFVLFPGDLVYGRVSQTAMESQFNTWLGVMQTVYDANIGVYPVRGNHDVGDPAGVTAWNNVFTGAYSLPSNGPAGEENLTYSFSHKNAFIVGLDQYINSHRVNQTWLDAQLAANTNPHVFVFGHEPAFRAFNFPCLDYYPADRDAFWASVENSGGRSYFCGHDHFYDHASIDDDGDPNNDIHQYIVGSAGAPPHTFSPPYDGNNSGMTVEQWDHSEQFGYVLVEVKDSGVTMRWFERDDATGEYAAVIGSPDFDSNGIVNWDDLAVLAGNWLRKDCRISNDFCDGADLDHLTNVDLYDLAIFAGDWFGAVPLEFTVTASTDDAEERNSNGNMYLNSSDLELINDVPIGDQTIGMRFNDLNIQQGQQIANAYIQFTVDETIDLNPCSLTIYGQASDNAVTFPSDPYDISSRPTTAASVLWNPPPWTAVGHAGADQQTPDIASVIQEIVNRPGWASGNSLVIIIVGSGRRTAESYDGDSAAAPLLHLELAP